MANIYLGLVHYPVNNKRGDVVTTSVTNMDIHDISRSCKTFGISEYHLITPLDIQHQLVGRILGHWKNDEANLYNPDRSDALSLAYLSHSFDESLDRIRIKEGMDPLIVVTGASFSEYDGTALELRAKMELDNKPIFLLFGTGWGLNVAITDRANYKLAPIRSMRTGYNHLSVRSAVAIYLNQLCGHL